MEYYLQSDTIDISCLKLFELPWAILKRDSMPAIAVSARLTALMDSAPTPHAAPSLHRCPRPLSHPFYLQHASAVQGKVISPVFVTSRVIWGSDLSMRVHVLPKVLFTRSLKQQIRLVKRVQEWMKLSMDPFASSPVSMDTVPKAHVPSLRLVERVTTRAPVMSM